MWMAIMFIGHPYMAHKLQQAFIGTARSQLGTTDPMSRPL
ncbi:MAG: hypothetical protein AVDCRST_MAG86-2133 [uncultured Truepera sp.]|uniref:Uncharacterized protein n=1 Tax=uncultured Truepera sp. TaxID=543023 RepID=A0A6J4VD86_9DEIN|nr:MAG: hypothetical protein AVDCRST_MAG86-2133 [uncultured Truepera sp.]